MNVAIEQLNVSAAGHACVCRFNTLTTDNNYVHAFLGTEEPVSVMLMMCYVWVCGLRVHVASSVQ